MSILNPFEVFYEGFPYGLNHQQWQEEFAIAEELLLNSMRDTMKVWRGNKPAPWQPGVHSPKPSNSQRNQLFFPETNKWQNLTHSFVVINDDVYALLPHGEDKLPSNDREIPSARWEANDAFAGAGAYDVVKYAINKHHQPFVVKIRRKNKLSYTDRIRNSEVEEDLNLLLGTSSRSVGHLQQAYSLQPYLGVNLQHLLSHHTIALTERLDMSIQLFWQLNQLHHGHLSKSGKGYAHRDLKPDNIVYDPQKKRLTIIDYDCATTHVNEDERDFSGTQGFRANEPHCTTARAHDLLSAKRLITFPNNLADEGLAMDTRIAPYKSLLTHAELARLRLSSIFNTEDVHFYDPRYKLWRGQQGLHVQQDIEQQNHASLYGAKLALSTINYATDPNNLLATPPLAEAIETLYFAGNLSASNLDFLITQTECIKQLATLNPYAKAIPKELLLELSRNILNLEQNKLLQTFKEVCQESPEPPFYINKTLERLSDLYTLTKLKEILSNKEKLTFAISLEKKGALDEHSFSPNEWNKRSKKDSAFDEITKDPEESKASCSLFFCPPSYEEVRALEQSVTNGGLVESIKMER